MDNTSTPQPVQLDCATGTQTLRLAGVINIMAADALLAGARAAAAAEGQVLIECADVESFDMSALQILVALRRELDHQGRLLRMAGCRAQVSEDIARAGLAGEFREPAALGASG